MKRWLTVFALCASMAPQATEAQGTGQSGAILRIYLARHGQTDWNVEGKTQGQSDIPLNATGRDQATELKRRLAPIRFDAVYSSMLGRSRETADIVRGGVPLIPMSGLNERHFGKFEGRSSSSVQPGDEFERRRWLADDSLDGGESLAVFFERVEATLATIRKRHPTGNVLLVGHGGMNAVVMRSLFGLTLDQMRSIRQDNDEVYLIELGAGAPQLWKLVTASNLSDL